MKKSRFADSQIMGVLQQAEGGALVPDLCRSTASVFNVIDDFNREGLGIDVDFSLPSERVIRCLDQIMAWRAGP